MLSIRKNIIKTFLLSLCILFLITSFSYANNTNPEDNWYVVSSDEQITLAINTKKIKNNAEPNPPLNCINHQFVSVWELFKISPSDTPYLISLSVYDLNCNKSKILISATYDRNWNLIGEDTRGMGYTSIKANSLGDDVLNILKEMYSDKNSYKETKA